MPATTARLRTEGLTKAFPARSGAGDRVSALEGVEMTIDPGEFVSIVGPSGCGKSTLFNLLAGLDRPSGGRILLDGRPADNLLGEIGYMPQADLLMPWRTVLDNTALGLQLNGVKRAEARERARGEFQRFGLAGFEDVWPSQISGGMRQRAALLRTFLAGREVMLLDEPFGALDALTRQEMQQWLLRIWQEDRKTILFVTHDVEEALFLSDRVYVMSGRPGRIELCVEVELERPRELERTMTAPEFAELKLKLIEPLRRASAAARAEDG
ncbi:MAG: ABC transporter ATP-binding protein [Acidobacteria bacterium]|nr:MAG: ABC transporter ATP-binding protein [Acidobacteriota bacterium]MCL4286123.1 ABC transporter ATP-binding protein [Thermoleophilia bacterium]GIK77280.1 MAG: ABC transporter ATP-binding protein [Actinomycetes bacterium]